MATIFNPRMGNSRMVNWRMHHHPDVVIRRVPKLQAREWIHRGWDDLKQCKGASLAHGALIAILGAVLLMLGSSHPFFGIAAVSGYLLIGPIMATGLCELSRRRAAGEPIGFDVSLEAINRNPRALLRFGALLAAITVSWFFASEVLLRSVFHVPWPTWDQLWWGESTNPMTSTAVVVFVASGAVVAAFVFAISAVAVPLMIDRGASAGEAIQVSLDATLSNLPAMFRWSALIVGFTAFGFATLLVGMVVVVPLLGHATWHAYRDLVGEAR